MNKKANSNRLVYKIKKRRKKPYLIVNGEYNANLPRDWDKKLKEDLTKVFDGGEVYLNPPTSFDNAENLPDYRELRSYIAYWSVRGNYSIIASSSFDARMILAAGGRLSKKSCKPYTLEHKAKDC